MFYPKYREAGVCVFDLALFNDLETQASTRTSPSTSPASADNAQQPTVQNEPNSDLTRVVAIPVPAPTPRLRLGEGRPDHRPSLPLRDPRLATRLENRKRECGSNPSAKANRIPFRNPSNPLCKTNPIPT